MMETKPVTNNSSRNVEEITIPPEKREEILNKIKTSIIKIEHYKISKLLRNSSESKLVTRNWIEVNEWLNGWVFVYELSGCGFEFRCCHLSKWWCE